jgi:uncharacterized membrane protein
MNVSVLKTGTYCVMHLVVAIGVAYALTGNLQAALAIGVAEPFVQTFAFAFHDRYWAKREGRAAAARSCLRGPCIHGGLTSLSLRPVLSVPVLKTVSYAVMHMVVAMAVAYALTRSWQAALAIGTIEPVVQTFAFTLHDRLWAKAGRRAIPTEPGLVPAGETVD